MRYFDEYDTFVAMSGTPAGNPSHWDKVTYAALKLAGEAGEVAEVIGKSMRGVRSAAAQVVDLDPVKLALELGDVLWYVSRLASLADISLEDVAALNYIKLTHRQEYGKDDAAESEKARRYLETVGRL